MNKYDDIINLERPRSLKHDKMPIEKRASIFSPFAALAGFSDMIDEVERYKDERILLSDDSKDNLDMKIQKISKDLKRMVTITYFKDNNYLNIDCSIKKIDSINHIIILKNNDRIDFDDIIDIEIVK